MSCLHLHATSYCALKFTVSAQLQSEREREKINKTILNVFLIEKSLSSSSSVVSQIKFFHLLSAASHSTQNNSSAPKSLLFFCCKKKIFSAIDFSFSFLPFYLYFFPPFRWGGVRKKDEMIVAAASSEWVSEKFSYSANVGCVQKSNMAGAKIRKKNLL